MENQRVFWIDGLTSPSAKRMSDEVRKRIEQEIETKILKIEYAEFPDKNMKRLRGALGIEEYAKEAIQRLPNHSKKYPILIGCSMGGLIARYLIEKMDLKVKGLILLATPNKGINLSLIEKIFLKMIGPIPCVQDMRPESDFLKSLGRSSFEEHYYFFGGTNDSRVKINSSLPLKGSKSILIDGGHIDVDVETITKLANIIKILILARNKSL